MPSDLDHLIHLQRLETESSQRRRWLAELPEALSALDTRLTARHDARAAADQALAENQARRRALDKELAVVQGRLTKFKDQLMEVKTNKDTAMQHEIEMAADGVRTFEDQILDLLMQADELTAAVKAAESALADETRRIGTEREGLEADRRRVEREIVGLAQEREDVERQLAPDLVRLFVDVAAKRRGLAVAAIRDGHCSACQVRLRAQFVLEVRRGNRVHQCESCSRLLYVPAAADPGSAAPAT